MIFLRNALFVGILILVVIIMLTTAGQEPSTDQARVFLDKLQEGELAYIIPQFGDNTCHCQPRGGYRAYLCFESGESDNLAVLFGHKFKIGEMNSKVVPTKEKFQGSNLPWEQPESTQVDVAISFDKPNFRPYFLPLDTAYGHAIKESEFLKFCQDPSADFWRQMSLRLRPSLKSGLLPPELPPKPGRKPEFMADLFMELLPPAEAKYIKPKDAGEIIGFDGKARPAQDFEDKFPRLQSAVLRLSVVRRGKFQRWAIRKGQLIDPVFRLVSDQEIALKTPEQALLEKPGQGPQQDETQEAETR